MIDESQETSNEVVDPSAEGEQQRRRSRRRGRRGKSRSGASGEIEPPAQQAEATPAAPPPAPVPPRQHHESPPRHADHQRPGLHTFKDAIDRQVCVARMSGYPVAWPVNHRAGIAYQPLVEVGRSEEAMLLCDFSHGGPCVWPNYLGWENLPVAQEVKAEAVVAVVESPAIPAIADEESTSDTDHADEGWPTL